jgi:hypothetical protein
LFADLRRVQKHARPGAPGSRGRRRRMVPP